MCRCRLRLKRRIVEALGIEARGGLVCASTAACKAPKWRGKPKA